jgi:hypothetical protein
MKNLSWPIFLEHLRTLDNRLLIYDERKRQSGIATAEEQ